MTFILPAPDAVVAGTNTLAQTADALQRLGFVEVERQTLAADAAGALYGLDAATTELTFAVRDGSGSSRPGRIRLVETDQGALPHSSYRLGGHAIDVYCRDHAEGGRLAHLGGAEVGETVTFATSVVTLTGTFCHLPGGVPLVLLDASRRSPSVLDEDPDRLNSEVHSLVWVVPELGPATDFFAACGLPTLRRNSFGADPVVARLMALADPVPFTMAMLADEALTPSRLELLAYDTDEVVLEPEPGRPLRPGQMLLSFTVDDPAQARAAMGGHGAEFGPTTAVAGTPAATGVAPGSIWFEVRGR